MDFEKYTPWIIGGGAIILLLIMAKGSSAGSSRVASIGPLPRDNSDVATYAGERVERATLATNAFGTLASFGLGFKTLDTQEDIARIDADTQQKLADKQLEALRRTLAHTSRDSKRKQGQEVTLAQIQAETQRNAISSQERTAKQKSLLDAIISGLDSILNLF